MPRDRSNEFGDRGLVRHVGDHRVHVARNDRIEVDCHNVRIFADECRRDRGADAGGCASHHSELAVKARHHRLPLPDNVGAE